MEDLTEENKRLKAEKGIAMSMLFDLFSEELFGTLPTYLTNLLDEGPTSMMLRESMREATKTVLQKNRELKKLVDSAENYTEKFNLCYTLYEKIGYPFQYDIVEETEERFIVKVTKCPHIKYTRNNPVACSACQGIKLGIFETLFGIHLPAIKRYASMAKGDKYCMFELKKENI